MAAISSSRRIMLFAALLIAAPLAQATAQSGRRPQLDRSADPNDWGAYYDRGIYLVQRDPGAAEPYLQWASRLDPSRAEPLYARYVLYWTRHPSSLYRGMFENDRKVWREPEALAAEHYYDRALQRNPFVHEGVEMLMYEKLPVEFTPGPYIRGWVSYAGGKLPLALDQFARAIELDPNHSGNLHFTRAAIFVGLTQFDSAAAEVRRQLAQDRAVDDSTLGRGYQSKAVLEYAAGVLHLNARRVREARDAFGRALVEDPAFTPAHARMGEIALATGDTATALLELGSAVEIDGSDPLLRLSYAKALLASERPADALKQYRIAAQLAPDYAETSFALGAALDQTGAAREAIEWYNRFLERTTRDDPRREQVRVLIDALNEAVKNAATSR